MAKKKRYHQSMSDRMGESSGMREQERNYRKEAMRDESDRRPLSNFENRDRYSEMEDTRGGKRRLRALENRDLYSGYDERRAIEAKDFSMIHEDHTKMANLPQEVMMKEYPRFRYGLDPYLDDTINGVDDQMYADDRQMKKHLGGLKY